ncbi:GerAB/ArcD/ProY family transporter [Pontibacillus yanchengensis]|uniref:Uncharacterized protein n=1 Tax=Pontibacillus yanchengensis Y32 TaxID=1385514 RepID=A0A0A2TBG6_9BACI|nr:endospore germination permease [Pontibacillus yanchengensis]KGP72854.1 hypothetical protein N782_10050 [Pontibacillus yanchengensis Y32]
MKNNITHLQLFFITANFIIGSSLLLAPLITGSVAHEDAWLSMILAVVTGLLFNVLMLFLMKKLNYQSLFDIIDQAYGKWLGTLVNLVLLVFTFHLCALVVGNTDDFMVVVKPDTAPYFYQFIMIALAMYGAASGLKSLGKTNEAMSLLFYTIIFLSIILLIPKVEFQNFKPYLYHGWKPVIQGGYNSLGVPFLELILMTAIFTFVKEKNKIRRYYLMSILFGGSILTAFVVAAIGVEGAFMVQRETYPTYSLMRDIHATVVFERIEIVMGVIWIFVLFVKITTLFTIILLGLQHIGRSNGYNAYLLPLGIAIWTLTNLTHENIVENAAFTSQNWTLYSFTIYLLVILSLLIGLVKQKKGGQQQNSG